MKEFDKACHDLVFAVNDLRIRAELDPTLSEIVSRLVGVCDYFCDFGQQSPVNQPTVPAPKEFIKFTGVCGDSWFLGRIDHIQSIHLQSRSVIIHPHGSFTGASVNVTFKDGNKLTYRAPESLDFLCCN